MSGIKTGHERVGFASPTLLSTSSANISIQQNTLLTTPTSPVLNSALDLDKSADDIGHDDL